MNGNKNKRKSISHRESRGTEKKKAKRKTEENSHGFTGWKGYEFKRRIRISGCSWCFLIGWGLLAFHPSPCPLPSAGRGFQRREL